MQHGIGIITVLVFTRITASFAKICAINDFHISISSDFELWRRDLKVALSVTLHTGSLCWKFECCTMFHFRVIGWHGTDRQTDRQTGCNAYCGFLGEGCIRVHTGRSLYTSDNKVLKEILEWVPSNRRWRVWHWMHCVERMGISRYWPILGQSWSQRQEAMLCIYTSSTARVNFFLSHLGFLKFFSNGWEFLIKILHSYCMFISMANY